MNEIVIAAVIMWILSPLWIPLSLHIWDKLNSDEGWSNT